MTTEKTFFVINILGSLSFCSHSVLRINEKSTVRPDGLDSLRITGLVGSRVGN